MLKQVQKFWWMPVPLCFAAVACSVLQPELPPDPRYPITMELKVNDQKINVENAVQGISLKSRDKSTFPDNRGLYFPISQHPASMSMQDISFPLDVVLIDTDTVVDVITLNTCTTDCPKQTIETFATHAISLNAGVAKKFDLVIGRKVELKEKVNP